ncbi:hypothetical protein AB3X52_13500 [Nocardioides sp. DS6]|uniref:YbaK/aminoacyl-tRNA synthetase-associated domain-containing protein n=1 Tax=Nocardioides eburneus TaxID=3231482 RepID=A0ABV3T431_9ACTN
MLRAPDSPRPGDLNSDTCCAEDVEAAGRRPETGSLASVTSLQRARRDGVARIGAFPATDSQGRLNIKTLANQLGWDRTTALVLVLTPDGVLVEKGARTTPTQSIVRIDKDGRLPLPSNAKAKLDIGTLAGTPEAGSMTQVAAIAVPPLGQLLLLPAKDALQMLTGDFSALVPEQPSNEDDGEDEVSAPQRRRSTVRARFVPAAGG